MKSGRGRTELRGILLRTGRTTNRSFDLWFLAASPVLEQPGLVAACADDYPALAFCASALRAIGPARTLAKPSSLPWVSVVNGARPASIGD